MIVIVAILALLATGCVSRTVMTVPSPDGSAKAWVHESCGIPDCEVTVYLKSGWLGFAKVIAERSDCHINFAHIAWSPDSSKLGVYSDHGWCRDIQEGYDLKKDSPIPFSEVGDLVRRSIIQEYRLGSAELAPYKGDVLLWGSYEGPGSGAFSEKYR